MEEAGDGHSVGHIQDTWSSLATHLGYPIANGNLDANETLYGPRATEDAGPLDIKLKLSSYSTPAKRARQRQSREQTLSRLDVCKQVFGNYINRYLDSFLTQMHRCLPLVALIK